MTVLAMDLTGEHGTLAVHRDGVTVADESLTSTSGFSHLVFGSLQALLTKAGLDLNQIDCYASASGPGSFTGVRVGLATVKGLAEAAGKPAIGVSNLRALASCGDSAAFRVPVMDARRGDVFTAVFDRTGKLVAPETVGPLRTMLAHLDRYEDLQFVTREEPWLRAMLAGTRYAETRIGISAAPLARAVAFCAAADLADATATGDPALLDANYVRRSDAEMYWTDRPTT